MAERNCDLTGTTARFHNTLHRDIVEIEVLVLLDLPPIWGNPLTEVAHRIHEAHANQRQAEIARFFTVITGQHTEPSCVNGQRLVQGELGGKVRNRAVGQFGELA